MKFLLSILILFVMSNPNSSQKEVSKAKKPYVDFTENGRGRDWMIVNDDVMGGVSSAAAEFTEEGNLHWHGEVSLDNNGGFVSIRSPRDNYKFSKYKGLKIRMKGDGRTYGFTLRNVTYFNGISYSAYWPTVKDEWTEVEVPFEEIVGRYFGNEDPRIEPLDWDKIRELGVILYDKQAGPFDVEIDWIDLY